jgi:LDH2 family malate/lactate/ureidoglycolate dehydrogenase
MAAHIKLCHKELLAAIDRVLEREDVPREVRVVEAELMAEADLTGVPSHGVRMLPLLVRALREGRATRDPQIRTVRTSPAACMLDCDNGPGRYAATRAMRQAMEKAQDAGVGVCVATRTTHWGRAHAYASRAAASGMIGLCTTNAIPNMTGWGSSRPLLGNNPLAIGVPRGPAMDPIVLDMAMSQAAVGKVGTYLREEKAVPVGWGLDRSGKPTTDPAEIVASQRFLPMGEHKGAGLAIMMELLTGALAGACLSHEIARLDGSALDPNSSKFFLALRVDAFTEPERFYRKVEDLLRYLRESAEPGQEILYPGERGWRTRDRYLRDGIPIHPQIGSQLREIGMNLGA